MKTSHIVYSLIIQLCFIIGWVMMPESIVKSILTAALVGVGISAIVNSVVLLPRIIK